MAAVNALSAIYSDLGGDADVLREARANALTGDFIHEPTVTQVEIDESQHFTSFRLNPREGRPTLVGVGAATAMARSLTGGIEPACSGCSRNSA